MSGITKESKVLIVCGSQSGELEVSIGSAKNALTALREAGHSNVSMCEVNPSNIFQTLEREGPDVVFNAMHGTFGEDGQLSAILNQLKIPYTHSGVGASMIAMNKILTHGIMGASGVKMPNFMCISFANLVSGEVFDLVKSGGLVGQKFIVKPACAGSSVGVVCLDMSKRDVFLNWARVIYEGGMFAMGDDFIVEEMIIGREFDVVVVKDGTSDLVGLFEVRFEGDFYSYDAKYSPDSKCEKTFNPKIDEFVGNEIKNLGLKMHQLLGCRDVSRSEFKLSTATGEIYALEINTHPGISNASFVPKFLSASGVSISSVFSGFIMNAKFE